MNPNPKKPEQIKGLKRKRAPGFPCEPELIKIDNVLLIIGVT